MGAVIRRPARRPPRRKTGCWSAARRHPPEGIGDHAQARAGRLARVKGVVVVLGHAGHHQRTGRPQRFAQRRDQPSGPPSTGRTFEKAVWTTSTCRAARPCQAVAGRGERVIISGIFLLSKTPKDLLSISHPRQASCPGNSPGVEPVLLISFRRINLPHRFQVGQQGGAVIRLFHFVRPNGAPRSGSRKRYPSLRPPLRPAPGLRKRRPGKRLSRPAAG